MKGSSLARKTYTRVSPTPETRAKISAALKGRAPSKAQLRALDEAREKRQANPSYQGIHNALRRERGKASEHRCTQCDKQAQVWALIDGRGKSRFGTGKQGRYSTRLEDYMPLCRSCHRRYDFVAKVFVCPECGTVVENWKQHVKLPS